MAGGTGTGLDRMMAYPSEDIQQPMSAKLDQEEIIRFFDLHASEWDAGTIRNEGVIASILDMAGIRAGVHVLDVACGTGVLFPDYISRGVTSITGIDISSEMVKTARKKFPSVTVLCGDATTMSYTKDFNAIIIYNAFPHFIEPEKLLRTLASHLQPGGRLTVAHGMSRAAVDRCHMGDAARVSMGLMHENQLAMLMYPYLQVDIKISDNTKFVVSGTKA